MRSTSSSRKDADPSAAGGDPIRLWLADRLARQPEVMTRLVVTYRRLLRSSAARRKRLARGAGVTLAGAALLLALGAGALRPARVQASTINVDNGIVAVANDNKCSLVEAIINANSNNQVFTAAGECIAGSGADTINLGGGAFNLLTAYGGSAFYSGNGLPPISSDVTIEGNGATIERDASAPHFRIIAVSSSGKLTLNNTTVSGGDTGALGGGVYVYFQGEATLNNSTIFGNKANRGGGIASKIGAVTLNTSTVSGNQAAESGGGISMNLGSVTIMHSTVSGNEASYSGGGVTVLHGDSLDVVGSTIRGNSTGNRGGGIYFLGGGSVSLENSTITDNLSAKFGGGIFNRGGAMTFTNVTVTANEAIEQGGGLFIEHGLAQVAIVRTLVSGNFAPAGDEIVRAADAGPTSANARNVFGHDGLTDADAFANFAPGANDFNASSSDENVPLAGILGFLDNNGGPTFTHALVPGSPAIDFASSAACLTITDQRGYGRNVDGDGQSSNRECDSGAFEFNAILATPSPIPSNTPVPTATPTPSLTLTPSTTPTSTIGPSPTATATATQGPSSTATATATSGPSPTPTKTATVSPSPTTGASPTATLPPKLDWQVYVPVAVKP